MKRKLKDRAGLTLVEMLCAGLILSLMGLLLHAGLSMSMRSYLYLTAEAETQILLNSLTNAIAAELRYAHAVSAQTPEGGVVIRCLNPPEEPEEGGEAP